jgi:hypothetical protein
MRMFGAQLVVLALLAASPTAYAIQQDITLARYQARTIVTGTDMRSRPAGLAVCLTDVLIKVSGDPTHGRRHPARVAAAAGTAGSRCADW